MPRCIKEAIGPEKYNAIMSGTVELSEGEWNSVKTLYEAYKATNSKGIAEFESITQMDAANPLFGKQEVLTVRFENYHFHKPINGGIATGHYDPHDPVRQPTTHIFCDLLHFCGAH